MTSKATISNVLTELLYVLKGDTKEFHQKIITRKVKVSCADFRLTAIEVYLQLRQQLTAQDPVLLLIETDYQIFFISVSFCSPK